MKVFLVIISTELDKLQQYRTILRKGRSIVVDIYRDEIAIFARFDWLP